MEHNGVLPRFRVHLEAGRAAATVDGRMRDVGAFAEWFTQTTGRSFDPAAVTKPDLRDYLAHLQTVKRLKPSTVTRVLSSLSVFWQWARREGLAVGDPCVGVDAPAQQRRPPRWLSRPEQGKLRREFEHQVEQANLQAAAAQDPHLPARVRALRDNALFRLMIEAGLRVSEVCALKVGDVEINERSGHVVVRAGKGEKYREVPLNATARAALSEWIEVRPEVDHPTLITGRGGKPLQPRGVQRRLAWYARRAGVEGVTPHALRHTFGKNLVDAGRPLTEVSELLGHERLETTRVYTQPGRDDLRQAVEDVDWEES